MQEELPKITEQQTAFLMRYFQNGKNATEAYKHAYNCEGSSDNTITVEACRLLKNPNITPWLDKYSKNIQEHIEEEIKYSINDAFEELNTLQKLSMLRSKTYSIAMKAIENKCKLKGLFQDKIELSGPTVQMSTVEVNGVPLELNVGEGVKEVEN